MTPIVISKRTDSDRWMMIYDPPEDNSIGGLRYSCDTKDDALNRAREFRRFTGLNMNIEIQEAK